MELNLGTQKQRRSSRLLKRSITVASGTETQSGAHAGPSQDTLGAGAGSPAAANEHLQHEGKESGARASPG